MLSKGIFAAVLIAIEFLAVIASLVVLVWGLIRRRRRLWQGGIASVVLSLVLFAGTSVWASLKVYHSAKREIDRSSAEEEAAQQGSPTRMREWYEGITNLKLPPDAVYVNGRSIDEMFFTNIFLQFRVPADYQATFDANLQHATWAQVQDALTPWSQYHDWRAQLPFWDVSQMQGKTYYSKTMTDSGGHFTFEVTICYDPATNLVNYVANEIRD